MRLIVLVALFASLLPAAAAHAQTRTYFVSGKLTTVPPCVAPLFAIGDPWTMEVTIDLSPPEEDDTPAEGESTPESETDIDAESETNVEGGDVGDAADDESAEDDSGRAAADAKQEFTATESHPAHAFTWAIGSVVGSATGVTRIFVSNDHLDQDGIAWQALGYSATFEPLALDGAAIRGIQAGLVDISGSVFETTNLPESLALHQFDEGGFFQVFFQRKCGVFRNNPITGSVTWVQVNWSPAKFSADPASPDPTAGQR